MAELILKKQDLTYLNWSRLRKSAGTAGSLLKAYADFQGHKIYYKLSSYDRTLGIVGHESVNELIVDRLLNLLEIPHLPYRLIHADIMPDTAVEEAYVCASDDFKKKWEDKIALDIFYEAEHTPGESPLDFCLRMGWGKYIGQMLAVDFLILNRDRHGANIEVLRHKKEKTFRLAPLFDHGLSLLCTCFTDAEVNAFNVMADLPVQSFLGGRSAVKNLQLIPDEYLPQINPLRKRDMKILFQGLDGILSEKQQGKIWSMLQERQQFYEDFCHQRRNG